QVSNDTYKTLMERLPTLENSANVEKRFITYHQKFAKELEPLIKFIDFRRIEAQLLIDIIEPLEVIPTEIILSAYRYQVIPNDLNNIRGIQPYNKRNYVWDKSACGSRLIIEDN